VAGQYTNNPTASGNYYLEEEFVPDVGTLAVLRSGLASPAVPGSARETHTYDGGQE
jgi:hypothetical protein